LKIGTQEECFFAMCSNEDIEISNFGYQEGVRSYYISGCFGGFFGVHKILHDPIRYFDKEDNNETT
jgi:hypothetical protein